MPGDFTPVGFSHFLLQAHLKPGDVAVDGTVGNGHDLLFLCNLVGKQGKVFGFEIQGMGIVQTLKTLYQNKITPIPTLYFSGHERLGQELPEIYKGGIHAFIFNLGYLPRSDKQIITHAETTIHAFEQALEWLVEGGILIVAVYRGHPGGEEESDQILSWAKRQNPQSIETHVFKRINLLENAPYVLLVRKQKPYSQRIG